MDSTGDSARDGVGPAERRGPWTRLAARGDHVRYFFDDGRGGVFIYGLVTRAGPRQFSVTWESGIRQRFTQGHHQVGPVTQSDLALARSALEQARDRGVALPEAAVPASPAGAAPAPAQTGAPS